MTFTLLSKTKSLFHSSFFTHQKAESEMNSSWKLSLLIWVFWGFQVLISWGRGLDWTKSRGGSQGTPQGKEKAMRQHTGTRSAEIQPRTSPAHHLAQCGAPSRCFNNGWVREKDHGTWSSQACCHLKTVLTHTLAESASRLKTVLKILQDKGFNSVCICWKESGHRGREKPHQTPWGAISVKSLALGEPGPDPWGLRNA